MQRVDLHSAECSLCSLCFASFPFSRDAPIGTKQTLRPRWRHPSNRINFHVQRFFPTFLKKNLNIFIKWLVSSYLQSLVPYRVSTVCFSHWVPGDSSKQTEQITITPIYIKLLFITARINEKLTEKMIKIFIFLMSQFISNLLETWD